MPCLVQVWCLRRGDLLLIHDYVVACEAKNGVHSFCRCLFVDEVNELLLAAMSDKSTYVYKLDDAMPLAR